nr:FHA domain-containing protein DDL-like isoform X1 [Quercus suber]POE46697.1 fha domain-containing protein ddl [Quercus suber]
MGRDVSNHSESPVRGRGSPYRRSPSRRERSPTRHRISHRNGLDAREKHSGCVKSPKQAPSSSPVARLPSPQTKRLRRAQAEREVDRETERARLPSPRTKWLRRAQDEGEVERETEREHEKNHGRGSDRGRQRESRDERKERRPTKHENEVERETEREHEKNHGKGSDRGAHRERGSERESGVERKERRSRRDDNEVERERESNHSRVSDRGTHRERGSDRETKGDRKERSGRDDSKSSRSRHERSTSPLDGHHKSRHRSQSPQPAADSRDRDKVTNLRGSEERNNENDSVAKMKAAQEALEAKEKQKPSFELSGKLAAETNRVKGVTLLFNEPPEARKPDVRWRLYVFKGGEVLNEPLYIHRQSCYLFGRERRVADIPTDHPSCSKQHAVIQFRQVEKEQPDGAVSKQVRPYLMDLGSTNKTYINDNAVEPQRCYELIEKDTVSFGNSSREYVILHEDSAE